MDRLLGQTLLGGFPSEIARRSPCPVIIVKKAEERRRFWQRRLWERVSQRRRPLQQAEDRWQIR